MKYTDRRFNVMIFATLFTMLVIGSTVHYFTKEPTPDPAVAELPIVSKPEITSEDLQADLEEELTEERKRTLREKFGDASKGALKDGAKKTGKSFLERFIFGDEDDKEQQ